MEFRHRIVCKLATPPIIAEWNKSIQRTFCHFFNTLLPVINDTSNECVLKISPDHFAALCHFLAATSLQIHFTASAPEWRRNNMFLAQCVFLLRGHSLSCGPDVFNWRWLSRAQAPVSQQASVRLLLCCSVFFLPASLRQLHVSSSSLFQKTWVRFTVQR